MIQKLIHQFAMTQPITMFFAGRLHRMDMFFLKITGGGFAISQLAGWRIVQLTTIGANTGRERTTPLIACQSGGNIGLIASNFGRTHNPGWYYNLKANPECLVELNGTVRAFVARETSGKEYEKYWQLGVLIYRGYERYRDRAAHRRIPVMLLEPKK